MNAGTQWMDSKAISESCIKLWDAPKNTFCSSVTEEELAKQKGLQRCPSCRHTAIEEVESTHLYTAP